MSSKPTTMQLLEGLADAFNSRDVESVMSFFHEDCSLDMPRGAEPHGTRYVGAAEVRCGLKSRFEDDLNLGRLRVEHASTIDNVYEREIAPGSPS